MGAGQNGERRQPDAVGQRCRTAAEVFKFVQPAPHQPFILSVMPGCPYCGLEATLKIVSNPEHVCLEHALEFWTGLLVYARDRSEPCVKHERVCTCGSCQELSASYRRAVAIAAAGPPPPDRDRLPIRLAS